MALISCQECKKEISNQAMQCPHCGMPMQAKTIAAHDPKSPGEWLVLGLVLVGALGFSLYNYTMVRKQQDEQIAMSKNYQEFEKFRQAYIQRNILEMEQPK